jgi:hypothetical protein
MLKQLYFKIWTIHGHYNWNATYITLTVRLIAKIEFLGPVLIDQTGIVVFNNV